MKPEEYGLLTFYRLLRLMVWFVRLSRRLNCLLLRLITSTKCLFEVIWWTLPYGLLIFSDLFTVMIEIILLLSIALSSFPISSA
jgi:hypothetical protein